MTTIAFKGAVLAADRQCTTGTRRMRVKSKLRRLKNGGLAGGCGDAVMLMQFYDWLDDELDELPKSWAEHEDMVDEIEVLVAFPGGEIFLYNGAGYPVELDEQCYAIGSGSDYALAQMEAGKSAAQAVEYAQTRDSGTGFGVETLTFPPAKKSVR